ncbi:MAG: hypothetical protein JO353_12750 [Phycisphaerae bacterium]|nr:hypothetical protein [Phycisphaerae bacterium]
MSHGDCSLVRLSAGITGAVVLTAIHETVREILPDDAPRMDVVGARGITKIIRLLGGAVPPESDLHRVTLYGDIISNAWYYSHVGSGRGARRRGFLLGLAAGLGALYLPQRIGLGEPPHADNPRTQWLTVLYYLTGGLVAGAVAHATTSTETNE